MMTAYNSDLYVAFTLNHNMVTVAKWFVLKNQIPTGTYMVKKETEKAVLISSTSYSTITTWVPKSLLNAA